MSFIIISPVNSQLQTWLKVSSVLTRFFGYGKRSNVIERAFAMIMSVKVI